MIVGHPTGIIVLHILSATDGLTQSYLFKERLLTCEPIDLGRCVVDLRERHLDYWTERKKDYANKVTPAYVN